MLKNFNYILTIMLYPFILILSHLLLNDYITGDLYLYILFSMIIVFIPSFIMTLYGVLEDILNSKSKWRIIFVILFSIIYIPYYYTKHISKQEVYLGVMLPILSIILTVVVYNRAMEKFSEFVDTIYSNKVVINERYSYISNNSLIRISVDKSFRCDNNVGDYIISCDRLDDDSFVGVYSYDISDYSIEEVKDIMEFHLTQTLGYIKDSGYEYDLNTDDDIIRIYYNNMVILFTQNNYIVDDKNYSIIIMKELPKELLDINEFKKMIESIEFLNYNNGVSS